MQEEILPSRIAPEDSLRLALLFCAESTTNLHVTACDLHEYFNVNTSFVLPVQVRSECRQNWLTFSSLCPASADLDLAMSALNMNLG